MRMNSRHMLKAMPNGERIVEVTATHHDIVVYKVVYPDGTLSKLPYSTSIENFKNEYEPTPTSSS